MTLTHAEALAAIALTQLCRSRRACLLWHVHNQRRHEIRRAGLRYTPDPFSRPALAAGQLARNAGAAVALRQRQVLRPTINDAQAANENAVRACGAA